MTFPAGAPSPADWRLAYVKVQLRADAEILALLRQSLRDIRRDINAIVRLGPQGIGDAIRLEQMQRVRQAMLREQAAIFNRMGLIIEARRAEAAARASQLGSAIDSLAFRAAGRELEGRLLADSLQFGLTQSIETAVVRMTQSQFPLAQRIYRTQVWMEGRIQTKINSALARGLSAREFAAEARDWFDPRTPGGVRYASMRLARTEINNAFHATSVNQAADKPWVTGMKWHLSGSHPKADVCDEMAKEDHANLGVGIYRKEDVPRKPHPHCFCFVTPELTDEDEFLDTLVAGGYDDYLDQQRLAAGRLQPGSLPGLPESTGLGAIGARRR